ncbi:aspartate aminotransferase family protein [Massilia sp. DJPM01]|uniref:pyridoxal phosphate-dependent decarboxylase family protein n=1 Tax=Massilia sp. DJPM01 TaxID=3024404 RepID=UPI00259E319F|nr:aspartate aminotransferase family protein [Massilia sp. DJPM01]MDM5181943.1 aspartate aminotransferase family protein [Massilia sp. DJPM01]
MSNWTEHFIHTGPGGSEDYRNVMANCTQELAAVFESAKGPYSGVDPLLLRENIFGMSLANEDVAPLDTVIKQVATDIARHAMMVQHPHCIAHLHTPPMLCGIAAENFIAAQNQSMDSWDQSGSATFVEQHVIASLCSLFSYPDEGDGVFTSGGTQGNIMALLIARDWFAQQRCGHNVQRDGLPPYASRLRIIGSAKSHFTLEKAASVMGLGQHAVVRIPTNPDGTMIVEALESTLRQLQADGLLPFAIVGTAGTTDHGAVDDLREISRIARESGIWFHVDAAYGGAMILSQAKQRLAGIELADSLIVDFHKMWFQPVSCGALLLRDTCDFKYLLHHADYLNRESDDLPNLVDKTISTTRRFDALKVFMMLRAVGTETLGAMVDHLLQQTTAIARLIRESQHFELLAPPVLSTVLFRYTDLPETQSSDAFNRQLRVALLKRGIAVLGETTVAGKVALKLTILNPCLSITMFADLFENIVELAETFKSDMLAEQV